MNRIALLAAGLSLLVGGIPFIHAQEIKDFAAKYDGENGKGYLQPLADILGAGLNSSLYHGARIPKTGLHIYLGVETVTAFITEDQKTFTATTEEPFYPAQTAAAPTIFGQVEGVEVTGTGGSVYTFPGGLEAKRLPIQMPQITVGSIYGTEAMFRFYQLDIDNSADRLKLLGFGLRHSLNQYLTALPCGLSAGVFLNKFEITEFVKASALLVGVQGSYVTGIINWYGGVAWESSKLDVSYESSEGEQIEFALDGANTVRLTLGLALRLAIFDVHADYNLGAQNILGLGAGFAF